MAIDMFERALSSGNKSLLEKGSQIPEILRNNLYRLKNATKNILDISRLESGMEPLKLVDISINDIIKHIAGEKKESAGKKRLRLSNNCRRTSLPSKPIAIR